MNKEVKKIFIVLSLFALSGGMFYNFQELWLSDNNLSTHTIGIIYSLCSLLSVSTIFLCSNLITKDKLKKFTSLLLFLKFIILLLLFILNNSNLNIIIKFLIMLDFVIDSEIWACIYPLISLIQKNDKTYALKELIYSYSYYGGILIASFLLGKTIFNLNINYNFYNLISSILMLISFIVLRTTNLEQYNKVKKDNNSFNILGNVFKTIKKDKITKYYLLSCLAGGISYSTINGMLITILTNNLGFSPSGASTFKMVLGILAVFLGTLTLEKLTFKNNYINFSIKYVGRLIIYLIAFLINNKYIFIISIIYVRLFTESYYHITNAPFVNRFSSNNQLAFCNFNEMVDNFSESIGKYLCGIAIVLGTRFNFLFSFIFIIPQIIFWFIAMNLKNKEKGSVNL